MTMTFIDVASLATATIIGIHGVWNGRRQYRLGLKHGRERERRDAQRARNRVVSDVQCMMLRAALDELDLEEALDIEEREL